MQEIKNICIFYKNNLLISKNYSIFAADLDLNEN